MTACRKFARWVIEELCFEGCDLDGADAQEKARELGLIVETKYDPAIHGAREHFDVEPGGSYFELSGELAEPSFTPPPIFPAGWLE